MRTRWTRLLTRSIRRWPRRTSLRRSSLSPKPRRTRRPRERPEPNLREVRIFSAKARSYHSQQPASADFEPLEEILGHRFDDRDLLERALTHKSRVCEKSAEGPSDNEQLEFLGDAILGFLTSEALVARHPSYGEGRLSKMKAHLVSASHLHRVAVRLGLGLHLLL